MEISLIDLRNGKKARIKRFEGGSTLQTRLAYLNIRVGKEIKMVAMQPFRGPVVIEVGGRRVTLGRGIAEKIFIEKE